MVVMVLEVLSGMEIGNSFKVIGDECLGFSLIVFCRDADRQTVPLCGVYY